MRNSRPTRQLLANVQNLAPTLLSAVIALITVISIIAASGDGASSSSGFSSSERSTTAPTAPDTLPTNTQAHAPTTSTRPTPEFTLPDLGSLLPELPSSETPQAPSEPDTPEPTVEEPAEAGTEEPQMLERTRADGTITTKWLMPDGSEKITTEDDPDWFETVTQTINGVTYVKKVDKYGNVISTETFGEPIDPHYDDPFWNLRQELEREKQEKEKRYDESDMKYESEGLREEVRRQFNAWNAYRASKGLPTMEWSNALAHEADKWAQKLAYEDAKDATFYDTHPHERTYVKTGIDPEYNATYVETNAGENVWSANSWQLPNTLDAFIASPPHNDNLLYNRWPNKTLVGGISIVKGTQTFNGHPLYYIVYKFAYKEHM